DAAVGFRLGIHRLDATSLEGFCRMEHRVMLQLRANYFGFARCVNNALNGGIVTFGSAAGKDNLSRFGPDDFCNCFSCFFDSHRGLVAELMSGGSISTIFGKIRRHGFQHPLVERSGGGMIEVNGFHRLQAKALMLVSKYIQNSIEKQPAYS